MSFKTFALAALSLNLIMLSEWMNKQMERRREVKRWNNSMTVNRNANVTPLHQRSCASVSVLPYIHWAK